MYPLVWKFGVKLFTGDKEKKMIIKIINQIIRIKTDTLHKHL